MDKIKFFRYSMIMNPQNPGFQCRLCGECCNGDMKIFLNPRDVQKMTQFLLLKDANELLKRNFIILDMGQNGALLPRIRFRKVEGLSFCPFLENRMEEGLYQGLCQLHPNRKPLVCALAPIARELDLEKQDQRFYFQPPFPECPGCNEEKKYLPKEQFPQLSEELKEEEAFFHSLAQALEEEKEPALYLKELYRIDSLG